MAFRPRLFFVATQRYSDPDRIAKLADCFVLREFHFSLL